MHSHLLIQTVRWHREFILNYKDFAFVIRNDFRVPVLMHVHLPTIIERGWRSSESLWSYRYKRPLGYMYRGCLWLQSGFIYSWAMRHSSSTGLKGCVDWDGVPVKIQLAWVPRKHGQWGEDCFTVSLHHPNGRHLPVAGTHKKFLWVPACS